MSEPMPENLTCIHCGKQNIPLDADIWTCEECISKGHGQGTFLECPVCMKEFYELYKSGEDEGAQK
jgi:hypothetical protein